MNSRIKNKKRNKDDQISNDFKYFSYQLIELFLFLYLIDDNNKKPIFNPNIFIGLNIMWFKDLLQKCVKTPTQTNYLKKQMMTKNN